MAKRFLWKIGGEAGFGILTTGQSFSKIACHHGYYVYNYFEYPSLIRGGHNTTETLISDEVVFFTKYEIDLLICLNKETYDRHKQRLHPKSVVIYDDADFTPDTMNFTAVDIPIKKILKENEAPIIMMNNIALGASLAAMDWEFEVLERIVKETFSKKGKDVVQKNIRVARIGFDTIHNYYPQAICHDFPNIKQEEKLVITGNDAFALGAIVADCRLYSAYPMTPSSTILTTLAVYAEKVGMVVRHAEDEIAVINTALGSSWAGVRSAVGTSGGGFALMVESVSFAGIAEIPIVIFLGQRPGPATGLPTWTEQGDLLFAVHSGHGEFLKIVLAPGDVEEMYQLTAEAFDLADIYQTPVIIMSDKLLSESHQSTSVIKFKLWSKAYKPDRGKIANHVSRNTQHETQKNYLRYKITDDGVSPMLIPGQSGVYYQSNSYEHSEDGHTTEESLSRIDQVNKRNKKETTYLKTHFKSPIFFGDSEAALVFVSWGANKGAILEAMKRLKSQDKKVGFLHFTHLYPMDEAKIRPLFVDGKKYILVENNSHGQFGKLLRQQTGVNLTNRLLKYDGRPIWAEEIIAYVTQNS